MQGVMTVLEFLFGAFCIKFAFHALLVGDWFTTAALIIMGILTFMYTLQHFCEKLK